MRKVRKIKYVSLWLSFVFQFQIIMLLYQSTVLLQSLLCHCDMDSLHPPNLHFLTSTTLVALVKHSFEPAVICHSPVMFISHSFLSYHPKRSFFFDCCNYIIWDFSFLHFIADYMQKSISTANFLFVLFLKSDTVKRGNIKFVLLSCKCYV